MAYQARIAPSATIASATIASATIASALAIIIVTAAPAAHGQELLDRIFGAPERAAPAAQVAQAPGQELVLRIDRLEGQIRQLTGTIEQLQYRNQQLEAYLRRLQEDTDFRFQELGKGGQRPAAPSNRPHAAPASPAPAGAPTTGKRGDAFDPAQHPNAPGAPHALGTTAAAGHPPGNEPPIAAPAGRPAGTPLDIATLGPNDQAGRLPGPPGAVAATQPPSQTPKDEFDLGYGYVLRKDYALAEDTFRSFLTHYPGDRMAGEATFWLGETLYQRQKYRDAAEAFLNVSTKYDGTPKAPDALLRLGQSLAAIGEKEAACASFGEIGRKFPRASTGVKQAVEREQKRVRC